MTECWVLLWQNEVDHAENIANHHMEYIGSFANEWDAKQRLCEFNADEKPYDITGENRQVFWSGYDHYWLVRLWPDVLPKSEQ